MSSLKATGVLDLGGRAKATLAHSQTCAKCSYRLGEKEVNSLHMNITIEGKCSIVDTSTKGEMLGIGYSRAKFEHAKGDDVATQS